MAGAGGAHEHGLDLQSKPVDWLRRERVGLMSWFVAYLLVACAGLIIALAMFKVGSDADAYVPVTQPACEADDLAEIKIEAAPSGKASRAGDRRSPDLPVVEPDSIGLVLSGGEDSGASPGPPPFRRGFQLSAGNE